MVQPLTWHLYPSLGYPIPPYLRSPYILKIYHKAMKNYVPKVYPGRLTLFTIAGNLRVPQSWEMLALGGADIYEIPGDHRNILLEPQVGTWAEKLNHSLIPAQNACSEIKTMRHIA
jgi:thioesterase domain-containing protein